mmetsp:Transcript_69371/g.225236  ORF Transcript_69371/g.225236 Transcript_69371/m.225236 type:complete len:211 (-) Transcript_69371:761-1393(-)
MCCIEYGRLRSNPLDTKSFDNNCEPLAERASGPLLRKLLVLRASKRCCAVELLIQAVSAAGAEQHHRQLGRAGPALAAHIDIVHQEARANRGQEQHQAEDPRPDGQEHAVVLELLEDIWYGARIATQRVVNNAGEAGVQGGVRLQEGSDIRPLQRRPSTFMFVHRASVQQHASVERRLDRERLTQDVGVACTSALLITDVLRPVALLHRG